MTDESAANISDEDITPDADDEGDALPEELKELIHSEAEAIVADNIDSEVEHE